MEFDDVRKSFGTVRAVRGVSFRAADGKVTGLLGPNGAGKTTSLRIMTGLLRADGGTVRIDGIDVMARPAEARARMGVLPDARGLYPRLTARENIAYYGRLRGMTGTGLARAVDAWIERLGLEEVADRRVAGFSQGERAKVALARALVHDPSNVVLDEPTNGLDVMSTRAVRDLIRGLRAEGRCVLFSSHIMQEVSALCDEIVVIAGGRVVAEGDAAAIMDAAGCSDLEEAFVALAEGDVAQ
ncbi:MAG: ATP-binding cassette domain-containing protein [Deltaproteobacteria bacterium]|nr:MAG: ATP-binding cassette domain-containing protein [Deltaproteobacteria bacterium]